MLHLNVLRLRRQQGATEEEEEENELDVSQEDMRLNGGGGIERAEEGRRARRAGSRKGSAEDGALTIEDDSDWLFKVAVLGAISASGLWGTLVVIREDDNTKYGGRTLKWWLAAAAPLLVLCVVLFIGVPVSILLVNACMGSDDENEEEDSAADLQTRYVGTRRNKAGALSATGGVGSRGRRGSNAGAGGESSSESSSGSSTGSSTDSATDSSADDDVDDGIGLVATPALKVE